MTIHKIAHHKIQDQQDIQFHYTGTEQCAPGQSWGPGIKDSYKLFYIHSGTGLLRIRDTAFRIDKGHVFLLSPGVLSFYQTDEKDPWNFSWVAFDGAIVPDYLKQAGFTPDCPVIRCDREQEIRQCFNRLFDANQHYYSKPLQMTSALYAFLALVLESARQEPSAFMTGTAKDHYISQAVRFLANNYTEAITVADMARNLGLNRKYMTELFKEAVGMPPQQYLGQLRISKASELLTETSLSVKEIAYSVGYANPLHFSKMFSQRYGRSPSAYRKLGSK
ncbi:AraC family transcriptional regulator [Paenibacillus xanthanilyticus]|uniref:Helix-turn-helix domain-containing protein n=1 Tax=Paenibacillus xanthanilyticus TaxID=1783531 RepID=A0ABV8JZB7_9BACL